MPISQMLLPEFDHEMVSTRKLLANLPEDKLDYQPHPKSMKLGRLAGHIAEMAGWTAEVQGKDSLDIPADAKPNIATSKDQLLAFFDANVAKGRAALESLSDEEFQQPWSLIFGGHKAFTLPKYLVVRNVVLNHIIHHRGQLGVYYRLNDVAVPGMYGPSADDKSAANA
ncbi:MAG TPA: DinB family protein [Bryobacteraceae bacterium]|jgi:uncharacterized damage-inducible protein DinB|nr:DinB family protein [Bryobacteraceae bacterium]